MSYEEKNSYRSEQIGYESNKSVRSVGKITGDMVAAKLKREKDDERKKERALLEQKEFGKTRQLIDLGKLSSYIEAFDFIKLEDQILPPVENIDNPKVQESFINGYNHGTMLVKHGLSEKDYHNFCEEYERKYNINKGIHK